jgi:DNA-binding NarL/FixJ family response regulator
MQLARQAAQITAGDTISETGGATPEAPATEEHRRDEALHAASQALGLARLSARERQLVTLVAQGRTDAQIGAELCISMHTVHTHLDRIRDKTGCRRRADLTRLALQAGLV